MGFFEDWDDGKDRTFLRNKVGTILGGVPNSHDFIPSIVCVILYTLLFVPITWRLHNKTLTFAQVWRPLVVILTRIASFAIRIKLSEGQNWNKDLFVAELVLLRISPILLTSALLSLFQDAVIPYLPQKGSPRLVVAFPLKYFVSFLQMATYFCLGLTIAIAFDVKQAINGNGEAKIKLHRSKEISIYMLLAVNGLIYFLSVIPFVMLSRSDYNHILVSSKEKEVTKFSSILAVCTFLLVVAGFKAAQLASHGLATRMDIIINKKVLFYGICVSGEYIACALFAVLAWNNIVPTREGLDVLYNSYGNSPPISQMREGGRPLSLPRADAQCPSYSLQGSGETFGPHPAPLRSSAFGGPFVETRPYLAGNVQPIPFHPMQSLFVPNKRGSTQTLSTISEVRYSSPSKSFVSTTGGVENQSVEYDGSQQVIMQSPWLYPHHHSNNTVNGQPPLSATESVKSHWSDDSEDDKKGFGSGFNLVKSTRDSLTRKSSKGSRTSSNKGEKSSE